MLQDQKVPDAGLEDIPLYENILISGITKVSTRPEFFPCAKVISWILPKANARNMIMYNVEGKGFPSFTPTYLSKSYSLQVPEVNMIDQWKNGLSILCRMFLDDDDNRKVI